MLPFIIAAAASIIAAEKKRHDERQAVYLDTLKQNAHQFGGNTQMADVISANRAIGQEGANYGPALGLVGKLDGLGGDSDPDVTPNDQTFGEGSDIDSLLKGWKQDDPENDDDFALLGVRRR